MPVFVQQEICNKFLLYVAPTFRQVCDRESQSKLSPFGFWRPSSLCLGMAGLFAFIKLLVVTLTDLFFKELWSLVTSNRSMFHSRYLWTLIAGPHFAGGRSFEQPLAISWVCYPCDWTLLEKVARANLFPLFEAVRIGICNSTACRWRSWLGLWLCLAYGGGRWSVSSPPQLPLTFCIQQQHSGKKNKLRGIFKLAMQSLWSGLTASPTEAVLLCVKLLHWSSLPIPHAHAFSDEQTPPRIWPALNKRVAWGTQSIALSDTRRSPGNTSSPGRLTTMELRLRPSGLWDTTTTTTPHHLSLLMAAEEASEALLWAKNPKSQQLWNDVLKEQWVQNFSDRQEISHYLSNSTLLLRSRCLWAWLASDNRYLESLNIGNSWVLLRLGKKSEWRFQNVCFDTGEQRSS